MRMQVQGDGMFETDTPDYYRKMRQLERWR